MDGQFWYVHVLGHSSDRNRHDVGMTRDLEQRLKLHNSGQVAHTSKHTPWQVETAIAFRSKDKAVAFEKYLKSHSGRAFAKKRF